MAPLISSRGYTADVHPHKTTVRNERRGRYRLVLSSVGISLVLVLALLPSLGITDAVDTSKSSNATQVQSYDFRIYALNCTSQKHTQSGTLFKFATTDLPYDFSSVNFGDYRTDTTFSKKYYGGSGILVGATGKNATIVLRESSGQFVTEVNYHGQTQVVFNGRAEYVSYPSNVTTYEGTERIIQSWRNTTWNPSEGVIVEHPTNVTLTDAKFYVMALEPIQVTDIPEFELLPLVVGAMALIVIVRNAIARRPKLGATVR